MFSAWALLLITAGAARAAETVSDLPARRAERLIQQGRFAEATHLLQQSYDDARSSGVEDLRLADAAANLARIHIGLDRFAEAEPLVIKAVEIDRRLLGDDAPQTAIHSLVLAKLYLARGRPRDAEQLLLHARPIIERASGSESLLAGTLLNHLGLAYDLLGRLPEALQLYQQSLRIYEKKEARPLAAIVMTNMIAVLIDLRQFDEAAPVGEKALAMARDLYGPEHPYTGRTLHALGTVYQGQKRVEDALAAYQKAMAIWDKNPGFAQLDRATTEASLGAIYTTLGYYAKAEALLRKSLATRESLNGPDSIEVASVLNNLGVVHSRQNRFTEARKDLERGLAIAEKTLGLEHPRALPLLSNLATVCFVEARYDKQRYAQAERLFRRLLAIEEQRPGPDRVEVADTLASLAEVLSMQKSYKEAKQLEGRALAIRRQVLGEQHPATVQALKQYTFLLRKSKD